MSFIAKNPLTIPEIASTPPTPQEGARGLFAGDDGWYDIDSSGNVERLVVEDEISELERIPEISNSINQIESELMEPIYTNITSTINWNINGYYPNGDLSAVRQATGTAKTSIFTVREGEKYKISGRSNWGQKLVCMYAEDNSIILMYSPNSENRLYSDLEITVPTGVIKMSVSYLNSSALSGFSLYKGSYVAKDFALNEDVEDIADDVSEIESKISDVESIPEMKNSINQIESELMEPIYTNITDTINWNINGYYQNGDLSGTRQATSTAKTAIFTVYEGEKYKIWGISNYGQKLICCYASDNSILLQYSPNYEYRLYSGLDITIPAGAVKMGISYYDASALAEFSLYKEKYIAKDYAINGEIGKDDVTFIDVNTNVNLFDKSTAVDNYYIDTSTGLPTSYSGMFYAYVPISEAGYYSLIVLRNFFGPVNAFKVHLYNSAFTKIATVTATETGGSGNLTQAKIYVTANHILQGVKYIGINGNISKKNVIMTVKGEAYPSIYAPYFTPYYTLNDSVLTESHNPLFKKVTVFDGDSIANGSSAADGSSGWASRIGNANKMSWRNYAVGGGCITYISGKHCISRDIDTIHNSYPTLDYLILEGGTNDADNLHSNPTKIGTIDPTDYSGTYDDTTFCGALDALFYKALNYYPTAKIGFIVAQKMGTSNVQWTHRKQFFTLAMQACEKWGIPYINLWDGSPLNPMLPSMYNNGLSVQGNRDGGYLYTDGQHLTAAGYGVITPKIEAWMSSLSNTSDLSGYIAKNKVNVTSNKAYAGDYIKHMTEIKIDNKTANNLVTADEVDSALSTEITRINNLLGSVFHYKGTCAAYDLPTSNNVVGDVWNLLEDVGVGDIQVITHLAAPTEIEASSVEYSYAPGSPGFNRHQICFYVDGVKVKWILDTAYSIAHSVGITLKIDNYTFNTDTYEDCVVNTEEERIIFYMEEEVEYGEDSEWKSIADNGGTITQLDIPYENKKVIPAGSNIVWVEPGYWDMLAPTVDLSGYVAINNVSVTDKNYSGDYIKHAREINISTKKAENLVTAEEIDNVLSTEIQKINSKFGGVFHYKGSSVVSDLPKSGNTVGDVWNISKGGNTQVDITSSSFVVPYGDVDYDVELQDGVYHHTFWFNFDFGDIDYIGENPGWHFSQTDFENIRVKVRNYEPLKYVEDPGGLMEPIVDLHIEINDFSNKLSLTFSADSESATYSNWQEIYNSGTSDGLQIDFVITPYISDRIQEGDNIVWAEPGYWDTLSNSVDLSGYATKSYVDSLILPINNSIQSALTEGV